ncbi:MAG: succinate dehydrogenase, cytochrome b556 subunit [Proteobacteria bacterium]|nr:succinate dehydrogenase, cytochrome b556 subunit [Pseudomonadota bacterium]|tara:strand:+ start:111 stop:485 length:375 start_codon:yes stop_codon:yes gene_type:complete
MTKETRPLSPHLSVYRWQVTNTLSIIHRLSGVTLYFGSLLFPLWIAAIAFDGYFRQIMLALIGHPLSMFPLIGLTFAFFYHSLNGIRHLLWDIGKGFEQNQVRNSGIAVVALSLSMTILFWWKI